jgi:dihydrofolate reductase
MPILKGYAIISSEGMIAHADGSFPQELKLPGDQRFFRAGVGVANLIIHGRNSGEQWPETASRPRIILSRSTTSLSLHATNRHAILWNPRGASLRDACDLLGVDWPNAVAAVLGGTEVFDLFLEIGYDAFLLSCADVSIVTGRKVFAHPDTPQTRLEANGLALRDRWLLDLAPRVTLERWCRSSLRAKGIKRQQGRRPDSR